MGARRAVPAAKASGRYRFGEGTFPRIPGNDGEAPIPDPQLSHRERSFTQSGPLRSPISKELSEAPIVRASREIVIAEWPQKREVTLKPSANKR